MSPVVTRTLLERLPKAELHCHLDGSVRPATLLELGREYRVRMPRDDAEALGSYMVVRDGASLEDYLRRFETTLAVMQTAEALERIAWELGTDAAAEGVRYVEVRFCPALNVRGGLTLDATVEAAWRGLQRAEREHGIIGRLILCGLRTLSPSVSAEIARLAVDWHGHGVVGFDLAGNEQGHPASAHAEAFHLARAHGLCCTCHAGEGAGAESVREALRVCCADRIGHGTHLVDDEALTVFVQDHNVALEICLTSNVQTRAAASYETHPLRTFYNRGMNVVLNTDNRLMSGTTLTDEYALAARHFGFDLRALGRIAMNGFESAFLPYEERRALVRRVRGEIERLAAPAP